MWEKKLTVTALNEFGYSAKLQLSCQSCKFNYGNTFSSPRISESRKFQINKNMVEAFLNIGKGHSAMEVFSMNLGIPSMDRKSFDKYVMHVVEEFKSMREEVLERKFWN